MNRQVHPIPSSSNGRKTFPVLQLEAIAVSIDLATGLSAHGNSSADRQPAVDLDRQHDANTTWMGSHSEIGLNTPLKRDNPRFLSNKGSPVP